MVKIIFFLLILSFFCSCQPFVPDTSKTNKNHNTENDTLPQTSLFWHSEKFDNNHKVYREKGFRLTREHTAKNVSLSIENDAGIIEISLATPQFRFWSMSRSDGFIRYDANTKNPYVEILQQHKTNFFLRKNNHRLYIQSATHCDSSYRIKPFQYTLHCEEEKEVKVRRRLICIQGKEKNDKLSPTKFDSSIHPILELLLMDSVNSPNVNYLFDWNDNKTKLQTTEISFDEYQQQSKWDNYLYVSTHNLGQQEKIIIKEMREMLNKHFD